jgi:hypothetical protein
VGRAVGSHGVRPRQDPRRQKGRVTFRPAPVPPYVRRSRIRRPHDLIPPALAGAGWTKVQ